MALILGGSLLGVLATLPTSVRGATLYVGGSGPGNYTTIAAAVAAAQPGDTIFVYSGVYPEATFGLASGVSLRGEARATTIIDGADRIAMGSWSNISGFTLRGTNGNWGLFLWFADNASIEDMVIGGYRYGVWINSTADVTLRNNVFLGTGIYIVGTYGDQLRWWNTHTIDPSNTVDGRPIYYWKDRVGGTVPVGAGQVILANVTDVTVADETIDVLGAVQVGFSARVILSGNTLDGNLERPIGLYYSRGSRVDGNVLNFSTDGIFLWDADDNTITNNTVDLSGVHLVLSSRNRLAGNAIAGSYAGIWFDTYSVDNTAENNTVSRGTFGILSSFGSDRATIANNTVSGSQDGIDLDGVGDIVVRNVVHGCGSTGILESGDGYTIAANTVYSNIQAGIWLYGSRGGTVVGNNVSRNYNGISVGSSSQDVTIANNTVLNNTYGIAVGALSQQDTVTRNNVTGNSIAGIWVVMSSGITVTENLVAENAFGGLGTGGVHLDRSTGILVHHNRFINNARQARDDGSGNAWDDGYPSGGNYWSDYAGVDNCSGPAQNVCPSPDGIGDTPYVLPGALDRYPLMGPPAPVPVPPSAPWNLRASPGDGTVTLTWSAPLDDGDAPVSNYRVYRGTAPGGEAFVTEIGNVTAFIDSGRTNGQTYYYQVSARNAAGEGPRSAEASATPAGPPSEPRLPFALSSGRRVILTWETPASDGGSPVTAYRIYRGTISGGEAYLNTVGAVQLYTDTAVTAGTRYFYRVSAVNAVGEGPRSSEVDATPTNEPPTVAIAAPGPGATLSGTYPVSGTSGDSDGAVQRVEVSIDNGSWALATGTSPWRFDWDTTAVFDGTHTVRARAFDGTDYSANASVTLTVQNGIVPPPAERPAWEQPAFWAGIAVVLVATGLIGAFLLLRRKKRRKPEPQ